MAALSAVRLARPGSVTATQLGVTVALSAIASATLVLSGDARMAFGAFAAAAFTAIGLVRPALFVALFLLLRPLLDELGGSSPATAAAGALVVAVAVSTLLTRGGLSARGTVVAFALVLLASAFAAAQAFVHVPASGFAPVRELTRLAALLAIYFVVAKTFATTSRLQALCVIVGLSGVAPAIWGIQELIAGPAAVEEGDVARITGPFVGPNPLGSYLALCALVLMFMPRQALSPLVRWPATALILVALYGTYSRVGWIILLLGALLLGWRQRREVMVVLWIGGVALAMAVPSVMERALPNSSETGGSRSDTGYESWDWRVDNWAGLLEKWTERPLLGWGLESTTYINERRPVKTKDDPGGGYQAHNMVVKLLVEGGVLLLAAWVALWAAILTRLRHVARRGPPELTPYARVVLVLWVMVVITAIGTADTFSLSATMFALLALTGAVEGAYQRRQRERPVSAPARAAGVPLTPGPPLPTAGRG